jgi:hypothetical protein
MPAAAKALMLSALIRNVYKGKTALESLSAEKIDLVPFTPPGTKQSRGHTIGEWLKFIHYSWMEDYFAGLPAPLKPFVAAALTATQCEGLKVQPAALEAPVKVFFERELYGVLAGPDVLPFSMLPESLLDPLLFMNRPRLIHLIDLLGIQDLSLDFKRVLARQVLDKLQVLLTPLQNQYFQYCMKESLIPLQQPKDPSFWLKGSNPQALIHSAGLWRLARLAAYEEQSWQWYLIHYLDKGRGTQLQKWIEQDKEIALQGKARDLTLMQVARLIGALK